MDEGIRMRRDRRGGRNPGEAASPVAKAPDPPEEERRNRRHKSEQCRARHPRARRLPGPVPGLQDPDRIYTRQD